MLKRWKQKLTVLALSCDLVRVISKKLPYLEVKNISGIDCALFSNRNKNVIIKNEKGRLA